MLPAKPLVVESPGRVIKFIGFWVIFGGFGASNVAPIKALAVRAPRSGKII